MNNLDASNFPGVVGDGVNDDTTGLLAALAAFCDVLASGKPGSLRIPAASYRMEAPFAPPAGWTGGRGRIYGDGPTATEILFVNPTDGFKFDLSVGAYRFLNAIELSDIGIMAGAACGCPINFDYGNDAGTAAETNRGCSVRRVSVGTLLNGAYSQVTPGAGWTSGPRFAVCSHMTLEDIFLYGSGNLSAAAVPTSGPGSGYAMQFLSCLNGQFDNITLAQWNLPILLGNAGNGMIDCQGLMFSKVRGIGNGSLFRMIGTQSQFPNGLAGCSVTDYMCDNGYSGDFYQGAIEIEYGSDIKIDGGWIQSGSNCSAPLVTLNGCSGIRFSKSKLYCSMPKPIVWLTGGTSGSFIEGANTILGSGPAVQVDKGSPNNKIEQAGLGTNGTGPALANAEPTTILA